MIVFVGDRPSAKNVDQDIPFVGTQSYKTLLQWIWKMDIDISTVILCNKDNIEPYSHYIYIALGREAENELKNLKSCYWDPETSTLVEENVRYFMLPHPSGKNRKLNDKKWLEKELDKCKDWINGR